MDLPLRDAHTRDLHASKRGVSFSERSFKLTAVVVDIIDYLGESDAELVEQDTACVRLGAGVLVGLAIERDSRRRALFWAIGESQHLNWALNVRFTGCSQAWVRFRVMLGVNI